MSIPRTHQPPSIHEIRAQRADQSLRFGLLVGIFNFLFWLAFYIIHDPSQLYFSAITLAICLVPYLLYRFVSYQAASLTFFFMVFVFLAVASLYNPPTPDIARSQHFFFLPFAIYAYALFYDKPLWFRGVLSAASVGAFLFFALTNISLVTPDELGLATHARHYAMWFNVLAGAISFAGMVHYVHSDLQTRDSEAYEVNKAAFEEQLELFYQPQVDQFGNITGAEALLRWKHPHLGLLTPDKFIPHAERTGSIIDIGKWVINAACAQLKLWQSAPELSELSLSVNISAQEFQEDDFVSHVVESIKQHHIDGSKLKLEITESAIMHDMALVLKKINLLRDVGVQFSLDDLGTGYSALSRVKDLPVSEIKIDRDFVSDITGETQEMPVTDTLIALGETMKVDSVAEGVETREQWQYLTNRGCQYFQGYYFGKPMEINMFNQFAYLKHLRIDDIKHQ